MSKTIGGMIAAVREVNTALGWRVEPKTFGDFIALMHTEVGEMTEAYRDHRLADATQRSCGKQGCNAHPHGKPEGVGSELADVLIRLLDTCDVLGFHVWEPDMELADVPPIVDGYLQAVRRMDTFGEWTAWLHRRIVGFQDNRDGAPLLRSLVTVAERFEIDLTFEYQRKIAYNRTRPYQHGGRTLSEATP